MTKSEFQILKAQIEAEGLADGVTIRNESGSAFDPDQSDWDGEGLSFILSERGIRRQDLTSEQHRILLDAYSAALVRGSED